MSWVNHLSAILTQELLTQFVDLPDCNRTRKQTRVESLGVGEVRMMYIETTRCVVPKALLHMHSFEVLTEGSTTRVQIGCSSTKNLVHQIG